MTNPYAPPEERPAGERPVPPPERAPVPPRPRERRPRPAPDPVKARLAARMVGRFALLMVAGLLCLQLPVPWQLGGIAFTAAALVVGTVAVRRVLGAGVRGPLLLSLAVGLGLGAFMLLGQITLLAAWPATLDLQSCRADALTLKAEDACQQDYERWISERSIFGTRPS